MLESIFELWLYTCAVKGCTQHHQPHFFHFFYWITNVVDSIISYWWMPPLHTLHFCIQGVVIKNDFKNTTISKKGILNNLSLKKIKKSECIFVLFGSKRIKIITWFTLGNGGWIIRLLLLSLLEWLPSLLVAVALVHDLVVWFIITCTLISGISSSKIQIHSEFIFIHIVDN